MAGGGVFIRFTVGGVGASAAHARYITRGTATGRDHAALLLLDCPAHVAEPGATYSELRSPVAEYCRQTEEDELARPRRGGGETRTHYRIVCSCESRTDTDVALGIVERFLGRMFPKAAAVVAAHQDTAHTHVHVHLLARDVDGKKVRLGHEYRELDRVWADEYARVFGREKAPGALPLGPYGRDRLGRSRQFALPPDLARQHVAVVGPSGSGKSRSLLIPMAASLGGGGGRRGSPHRPGCSFLATDPKSELWDLTSGLHRTVWRLAPLEPDQSVPFNWVPLCADEQRARLLAMAAMGFDPDGPGDRFWPTAEFELCAALFAHAATLPTPTPAAAYDLLRQGPQLVLGAFGRSRAALARDWAASNKDARKELPAGAVLGVRNRLSFLSDWRVRRFTSGRR
jgi:hypothetical protein